MSYIYANIAHQTTEHTESFYASHLVPALYYIDGVTIPEDSSGGGDADCVVQTHDGKIFVIEVKYHRYDNVNKKRVLANTESKKVQKLLDIGIRLAFKQIFDQGRLALPRARAGGRGGRRLSGRQDRGQNRVQES